MKALIIVFLLSVVPCSFAQPGKEDFRKFCGAFFSDTLFQMERIVFPLCTIQIDSDLVTIDTIVAAKSSWRFRNFGFWGRPAAWSYHAQVYDNFSQTLRDTGERVVAFEGIENGIQITLFFRLINNRWFLVKMQDLST
jgi:hypothetical protein